jgi:hypothetical protein
VVLAGAATAATVAFTGNDPEPTPSPVAAAAPTPTPEPTPEASPSPAAPSPTPAPLLAAAAPQGTYDIAVTIVKSTNRLDPAGSVLRGVWTVVTGCDAAPCTGTVTSSSGAKYASTWDGTAFVTTGTRESPCLTDAGAPVPGGEGVYHEEITNTLTVTRRTADGRPAELRGTGEQTQSSTRAFQGCRQGTTTESRTLVVTLK